MWRNRLFWFTDYQGTRETRGIGTGVVTFPVRRSGTGHFRRAHSPIRKAYPDRKRVVLGERALLQAGLQRTCE